MNNKVIDISVKRAQLKKNIKDNSILYDDIDDFDQDEYELIQGVDIVTYPDGEKYVGEWKDGLWHGRGTVTRTDGEKYAGEFKEGLPNGHGTHTDSYGNKYVAKFKDGIPTGQGTITYFEGSKYVGELKNGQAHGKGTFTFPDGYSFEGVWEKNEYIRNKKGITPSTNQQLVPSFYYRYLPIIWLIFIIIIGGISYNYIFNLK